MAYIEGKWRLNDVVNCALPAFNAALFTSNGESFIGIGCDWTVGYHHLQYFYDKDNFVEVGTNGEEGEDSFVVDEKYLIIDFGKEQEISEELYEFITQNARPDNIADKLVRIVENNKQMYEAGKKAEYDAFWDIYQANGARKDYQNAFSGVGWTDKIFKPKYPFGTVTDAYQMFRKSRIKADLTKFDIDISNVVNADYMFYSSYITKIGVFGVQAGRGMSTTFGECIHLETIEKLKVVEATVFNSTFNGCSALENITIEGEIANDINFQWSTKLSKDSITSKITHLSDTASGKKLTLSLAAIKTAFGADPMDWDGDGTNDGWIGANANEWIDLIESKPNWDIVCV